MDPEGGTTIPTISGWAPHLRLYGSGVRVGKGYMGTRRGLGQDWGDHIWDSRDLYSPW